MQTLLIHEPMNGRATSIPATDTQPKWLCRTREALMSHTRVLFHARAYQRRQMSLNLTMGTTVPRVNSLSSDNVSFPVARQICGANDGEDKRPRASVTQQFLKRCCVGTIIVTKRSPRRATICGAIACSLTRNLRQPNSVG